MRSCGPRKYHAGERETATQRRLLDIQIEQYYIEQIRIIYLNLRENEKNMRPDKFVSLLTIFLTTAANFISLCPANESHAVNVHLTVVPCTAHECNRTPTPYSCEKKECDNGLCNDIFLIELVKTPQQHQFYFCTPPVSTVVTDLAPLIFPAHISRSSVGRHVPLPQLMTPLRI
jgi:hypothetical protein